MRLADAALEGQALEEGLVLDQRGDEFAEPFIDAVAALERQEGSAAAAEVAWILRDEIGILGRGVAAIFAADRGTARSHCCALQGSSPGEGDIGRGNRSAR